MKLYHGISSVCSIKVRLGLAEIGLGYDEEVLDLPSGDQHDPAYLKLNPDGVVPTLVDAGLVVTESSLILEYLDREYNDSRLMPRGRAAEVAARHWLLRCLAIHAAINTLTFSTAGRDNALASQTAEQIEARLAKMPDPWMRMKRRDLFEHGLESGYVGQALMHLSRMLGDMQAALDRGDWVSGPDFGIVDIALLSYVDRLERLGFEGLWAGAPRVGDWLAAMQARPSYAAEVGGRIEPKAAEGMRAAGAAHWPALERRWRAMNR
ncbi:glutathione S-transferase family protein [Psychromarinibacter sp. C21-152]|uniref:Glutathione S-transferase family protein n=1 Tax=Psychromarinibacter sediminicola TaxID=3033385 RepID=A0AAE3NWX8_9RHOB|nr:glutathione S-transferase family protein [Psychromarinibacter sediminicola]MDF0603642.1 glutathione S-transferase family protein [Psychromarinibacter sediminicola]